MNPDENKEFKMMIDELVAYADYDPELKENISWLDAIAFREGVSFYRKAFDVLYARQINQKVKEWLKEKNEC